MREKVGTASVLGTVWLCACLNWLRRTEDMRALIVPLSFNHLSFYLGFFSSLGAERARLTELLQGAARQLDGTTVFEAGSR